MDRYTATKIQDGILINANISNIPLRKNTFLVFDKDLFTLRIDSFDNYKIQKQFKKIEAENKIHIFQNPMLLNLRLKVVLLKTHLILKFVVLKPVVSCLLFLFVKLNIF